MCHNALAIEHARVSQSFCAEGCQEVMTGSWPVLHAIHQFASLPRHKMYTKKQTH